MKQISALDVTYFGNSDTARDARIKRIAMEHGFEYLSAATTLPILTGHGSHSLHFSFPRKLTKGERKRLSAALADVGDIRANLDLWEINGEWDQNIARWSLV